MKYPDTIRVRMVKSNFLAGFMCGCDNDTAASSSFKVRLDYTTKLQTPIEFLVGSERPQLRAKTQLILQPACCHSTKNKLFK